MHRGGPGPGADGRGQQEPAGPHAGRAVRPARPGRAAGGATARRPAAAIPRAHGRGPRLRGPARAGAGRGALRRRRGGAGRSAAAWRCWRRARLCSADQVGATAGADFCGLPSIDAACSRCTGALAPNLFRSDIMKRCLSFACGVIASRSSHA